MTIDYDPTVASLLHPERRETVFAAGVRYSDLQLGVEAARLAYYKAEDQGPQLARLAAALGPVGYSRLQHFNTGVGAQAFAAYNEANRAALVAFRGTEPDAIEDVGVDASAALVRWSGAGLVHAGFGLSFEAIRAPVEQWLKGPGKDRGTLLVCGHSLGAALATIAAAAWRPTRLVTIGSPRVGNNEFVRSIAGVESHRIANCCDVVTRVPPRVGYDHVPGLVFIAHDAQLQEEPSASAIDLDRHRGRGEYFLRYALRPGNAPARDLADHSPVNYLRAFFR